MARKGGPAVQVQPVWLDGLWGSIFSFEGGRFFKKVPRALPYRVSVWFGEPMDAREATPEKVREAMLALRRRPSSTGSVQRTPKLTIPGWTRPRG